MYEDYTGVLAHDKELFEAAILRMQAEYDLAMAEAGYGNPAAAPIARKAIDTADTYIRTLRSNPYAFDVPEPVIRLSSRSVNHAVSSDGTIEITGYASVVEREYTVKDDYRPDPYTEIVHSGAFTAALRNNPSMELRLAGHDGSVLAETGLGLELFEDEIGLGFRAKIAATNANLATMRHADKCSFSFDPIIHDFDEISNTHHIRAVGLDGLDICLTEFPANPWTSNGLDDDEVHAARMAILDAELAKYGIE
jgi:HK97 family phage prohead protease